MITRLRIGEYDILNVTALLASSDASASAIGSVYNNKGSRNCRVDILPTIKDDLHYKKIIQKTK